MNLVYRGELLVNFPEPRPILPFVDVDESGEVECRVEAHILAAGLLGRVEEEVRNPLVNGCYVFKLSNKGTYVLEGRSAHDLRSGVLQEFKVKFLHISCLLLKWADLGDICDDVGTSFAHLLFLVLGEFCVKGEDLLAKAVDRHVFAHVKQVLDNSCAHTAVFVHSKRPNLFDNKTLAKLLAHVRSELIKQLNGRFTELFVLIVSQSEGEPHHVFFLVLIDHIADLSNNLDGAVSDSFVLIVKQLFNEREDGVAHFEVRIVTEILEHELHQGYKLV